MISILDPQLKVIGGVADNEFQGYLSKNELVGKKFSERSFIVYPKGIEKCLRESKAKRFSRYTTRSEFVKSLHRELNLGNEVLFIPNRNSLRIFFNTSGFIEEMLKVADELKEEMSVLVPPGMYGERLAFGMRPV